MIREAKEELGITLLAEHLTKIAIVDCFAAGELNFRVHVYRTDRYEGKFVETKTMIPEGWFHKENLPYKRMHDSDREWFRRAVDGEPFCANVYYLTPGENMIKPTEFLPFEDTEVVA